MFNDPRYRCTLAYFFAFDLVRLDGQDVRDLPLLERKRRLAASASDRTVCTMPHVERRGTDLFAKACALDLEDIIVKWRHTPYGTAENQIQFSQQMQVTNGNIGITGAPTSTRRSSRSGAR